MVFIMKLVKSVKKIDLPVYFILEKQLNELIKLLEESYFFDSAYTDFMEQEFQEEPQNNPRNKIGLDNWQD